MAPRPNRPSYAWENDAQKTQVEALAPRRCECGINVRLDTWHALEGGLSLAHLEQAEAFIQKTGYHRRDAHAAALRRALTATPPDVQGPGCAGVAFRAAAQAVDEWIAI